MTISLNTDPQVTGSFAAPGQSNPITMQGWNWVILSGAGINATVRFEKTYDQGTTWVAVAGAQWTAPIDYEFFEPGVNVQYRLNCTVFVAGPVNYRLVTTQGRN